MKIPEYSSCLDCKSNYTGCISVHRSNPLDCDEFIQDDRKVVQVRFNDNPPDGNDYKYFEAVMEDGEVKTFYHHKNNPIPTEEQMLGCTWEGLCNVARKLWEDSIHSSVTSSKEEGYAIKMTWYRQDGSIGDEGYDAEIPFEEEKNAQLYPNMEEAKTALENLRKTMASCYKFELYYMKRELTIKKKWLGV